MVALTATVLIGAIVIISNPRNFNAWILMLIFFSTACYLLGRMSFAFGPTLAFDFGWFWPVLLTCMNSGTGF